MLVLAIQQPLSLLLGGAPMGGRTRAMATRMEAKAEVDEAYLEPNALARRRSRPHPHPHPQPHPDPNPNPTPNQVFTEWDKDGDGYVDYEEFAQCCLEYQAHTNP